MNNNNPKQKHSAQNKSKTLPQLRLLKLEQLESVAGGPIVRPPTGND